MKEESPSIVEAMLHYMYHFDYSLSTHASEEQISPMIYHVRVHALAVKYTILGLQELAAGKFEAVAATCWQMDDFVPAIDEIYTSTHSTEQGLRKVAVDIACKHTDVLLIRKDFSLLLDSNGQFACGILKGLHSQTSPPIVPEYRCPGCSNSVQIMLKNDYQGYCWHCGGRYTTWNHYRINN